MMKEVKYGSIVDESLLQEFRVPLGQTLMNHAFNTCSIEQYLSVVSVLWPSITEVDDCLFISEFYSGGYEDLYAQFAGDKKKVEQFVNSWSLGDFFLLSRDDSVDNDLIFDEFCKLVKFFWTLRIQTLFPDRIIIVEIGWELWGERGMAITMYQEHKLQ